MKVDYISDLHLDFWLKEKNTFCPKFDRELSVFINKLTPNLHDVLVIAGDLGHYYNQNVAFLRKMKEFYRDIVIVAGNHDLYLISETMRHRYDYNSLQRVEEMKQFCEAYQIHYLDGNTIAIGNRTFGGCCMFWDSSYAKSRQSSTTDIDLVSLWRENMNDYHNIFMHGERIDPFELFAREENKLKNISDADIVITHYGPHVPFSLREEYKTTISTFYFFDGYKHIRRISPKAWIHGHTHDQVNERVFGCDILCNPLGYPEEKTKAVIKTFNV